MLFRSISLETSDLLIPLKIVAEASSDMTIYKIQSNVVYPFTDIFSVAGGFNLGYLTVPNTSEVKTEPALGGQIGLQADIKSIGFLLGYQALGARGKSDGTFGGQSSQYTSDILLSGMITQISYTF